MSLYPNELLIGDHNWQEHVEHTGPDGLVRARGLIPRDWAAYPAGCYASATHTSLDIPLIDQGEWPARIKELEDQKSRISDMRMVGNGGQPIPALDQDGKGYCWAHSSTSATMMLRCVNNQPYVGLSAYAIACVIKNYQDEGGWGAQSLDFITSRGVPSEKFWPMQSMSRSNDKPETWQNAALHKVTEGWIDLGSAQYDRNLTFQQVITLLLSRVPVVGDFNFWSHSVCLMDAVDGSSQWGKTRAASGKLMSQAEFDRAWGMNDPVTAGTGVRLWNSWGDSWSDHGMGTLTGSKAVPDGSVAPRVAIAAAA